MNSSVLIPAISAVTQPTLDLERIAMLRELCVDADPAMLADMFASWSRESAERLEAMRSAIARSDAESVKAAAHALKGSCANLGVTRLAEMSRLIEKHAAAPDAGEVVPALTDEFSRATRQLAIELQPPAEA